MTITSNAGGATRNGGPFPQVELMRIAKSFGPVKALADVTFAAQSGQVHALLGENGAGKTTLMRILYGLTRPDAGTILIDGSEANITSPRVARNLGIGMVTQHFALVGPMTVAENLLLTEPGNGVISLQKARAHVRDLSSEFGLEVDPDAIVEDLPVGGRQRVEILKALSHGCKTLVLDEPTAVLTPKDIDSLFSLVQGLCKDSGLAVVFISHKMHEVLQISDEVSVLRHGTIVSTQRNFELDVHQLTQLMVGADDPNLEVLVGAKSPQTPAIAQLSAPKATVLSVRDLVISRDGVDRVDNFSLEVRAGEIVAVAGVTGNGQSELVEALLGLHEPTLGEIEVNTINVVGSGIRGRRTAGMSGVSEDRHQQVVGELSVAENLALTDPSRFASGPLLSRSAMTASAEDKIAQFNIKSSPGQSAGTLSGGNMQKVLLARMFDAKPSVAVVAQPTRGLDVSSTAQVRAELRNRAKDGTGIVVISEDLDEVLQISDRIVVIYRGRIVGELASDTATTAELGRLMAGVA
jgi:general nucleoside transport system ATP-binding protein